MTILEFRRWTIQNNVPDDTLIKIEVRCEEELSEDTLNVWEEFRDIDKINNLDTQIVLVPKDC